MLGNRSREFSLAHGMKKGVVYACSAFCSYACSTCRPYSPCRLMFCFCEHLCGCTAVNTYVDAQLWVWHSCVCVRSTLACATTAVCGWYTLGWWHGGSVQKEVHGRWYVTTDPWSGWQTWEPASPRFVFKHFPTMFHGCLQSTPSAAGAAETLQKTKA